MARRSSVDGEGKGAAGGLGAQLALEADQSALAEEASHGAEEAPHEHPQSTRYYRETANIEFLLIKKRIRNAREYFVENSCANLAQIISEN